MSTAPRAPARFLWAGRANTAPVALAALAAAGGERTYGDDWDLYWTAGVVPDDAYRRLDGTRRVSGFKGLGWLCAKHGLARTLERARRLARAGEGCDGVAELAFAPRSFVFPNDFDPWRACAEAEPATLWISKVGESARGEGVRLVTDIAAVTPDRDLVLQEYVATPHLLEGCKYTLRVYVAVTSLEPLRVWVFPDGFVKLAARPFTTARASLGDRFVHLTNTSVLRDAAVDVATKRMTIARYREVLRRDGNDDDALFRTIDTMIATTLRAAREPMLSAQAREGLPLEGAFALVGFDILIDRDLRPWLLEVNMGPSLAITGDGESARTEAALKTRVVADLLPLVGVGASGPSRYRQVKTDVARSASEREET